MLKNVDTGCLILILVLARSTDLWNGSNYGASSFFFIQGWLFIPFWRREWAWEWVEENEYVKWVVQKFTIRALGCFTRQQSESSSYAVDYDEELPYEKHESHDRDGEKVRPSQAERGRRFGWKRVCYHFLLVHLIITINQHHLWCKKYTAPHFFSYQFFSMISFDRTHSPSSS